LQRRKRRCPIETYWGVTPQGRPAGKLQRRKRRCPIETPPPGAGTHPDPRCSVGNGAAQLRRKYLPPLAAGEKVAASETALPN